MTSTALEFLGEPPSPNAVVIVAHPDDETLWAGGLILSQPGLSWYIAALCRKSDPDRSPRFFSVLQHYGARGSMADLDDGPEQKPLPLDQVQREILRLLPARTFDLLVTHAPQGEYTRHRRHEEVSRAVLALWESAQIRAQSLYLFAYEDGRGERLPRAIPTAHRVMALPANLQAEKYRLITQVYGFAPQSWETRAIPLTEAFWCFDSPDQYRSWLSTGGAQG